MRVWLFSNIKDEDNVVEWCLHHARFGFEKIYILDHGSNPPISKELEPFSERIAATGTKIECEVINWALPIKMRAMNYALAMCRQKGVDWLLYIDGDEYISLHPRHNDSISHLIESALERFQNSVASQKEQPQPQPQQQQVRTRVNNPLFNRRMTTTTVAPQRTRMHTPLHVGAIGINWVMFGSSHLDKQPESKTLMEHFLQCTGTLDMHVKTIAHVPSCIVAQNPHYFNLQPTAITITASGDLADHKAPADLQGHAKQIATMYRSRSFGPFIYNYRFPMEDDRVDAFLAHYVVQSYDRNYQRKVVRPTDDCGILRTGGNAPDRAEFHEPYNNFTYSGMKNRYSFPDLHGKLKEELNKEEVKKETVTLEKSSDAATLEKQ